ncbi:hypothetical protein AsAng_0015720 [Aureispira anguillae]|uniref:Uncharacterized protein n=1 Tax=Aureispira anguillae TaxID=2864201 RepID=A0A915YD25_9BACT|nr:hypothetical protein AsAng_0015720 [Aureispira anguillae]
MKPSRWAKKNYAQNYAFGVELFFFAAFSWILSRYRLVKCSTYFGVLIKKR